MNNEQRKSGIIGNCIGAEVRRESIVTDSLHPERNQIPIPEGMTEREYTRQRVKELETQR